MKSRTSKRSRASHRDPCAWLGVGALTLGMGAALAGGTGVASADSTADSQTSSASSPSTGSAANGAARSAARRTVTHGAAAKPSGATAHPAAPTVNASAPLPANVAPATSNRSPALATMSRLVAAMSADFPSNALAVSTAAAVTGPVSGNAGPRAAAVQNPPLSRSFAVAAGAPRLENIYGPTSRNPAQFGPVLSAVVWALNEAVYQIQRLAPLAKPNQLPSSPGQIQVVGALNTVAPFGAPVKFAVTNAPANGTVTIDSQGFYTYTPNAVLAATGGTDTFAVTAIDLGFHLEGLFGLPGHTTTMVVPVTVAAQVAAQAQAAADLVSYHVYNTSWATQTFGAVTNQLGTVIARPGEGTQLQTTQSADYTFELVEGTTLLSQNLESSASSPDGTLAWDPNTPLTFLDLDLFQSHYFDVNCKPSSGSCNVPAPGVSGGDIYLADAPGTVYTVPAENAQQQSDILQNLVADNLSNARFYPRSQPTIGYTNPLKAQGFSPYTNNTQDNSTNTYTVSQTTSKTDSSQYSVSVKASAQFKLGLLTATAESSATQTWGTATANALTYTQSTTQTVRPGYTLYLYTETPVYRFYGDWSVVYGNTTYILNNVWFDSPNPVTGQYPQYLAAYTCQAGSVQCAQLSAGQIPTSYPNAWPADPTYPVAESSGTVTVSSDKPALGRPVSAAV